MDINDILNEEIEEWIEIPSEFFDAESWKECGSKLAIAIYADEGKDYDHFHFKKDYKGTNEDEGCLMITSANYFVHGNKTAKLNTTQIKVIVKFLKSRYKGSMKVWDYIIDIWNKGAKSRNNINIVPVTTPIPEYYSTMPTVQAEKKETNNLYDDILNTKIDTEETNE